MNASRSIALRIAAIFLLLGGLVILLRPSGVGAPAPVEPPPSGGGGGCGLVGLEALLALLALAGIRTLTLRRWAE